MEEGEREERAKGSSFVDPDLPGAVDDSILSALATKRSKSKTCRQPPSR